MLNADEFEPEWDLDWTTWDGFVKRSPQGSPFAKSWFIQAMGHPIARLALRKNGRIAALALLHLDDDPTQTVLQPFSIYQSILFSDNSARSARATTQERARVIGCLLEEVRSRFDECQLSLHWSITDIRPFDWFTFDLSKVSEYLARVRYTWTLSLLESSDPREILRYASENRRRDFRKASEKLVFVESSNSGRLRDLYEQNLDRQGHRIDVATGDRLQRITDKALETGNGLLGFAQDADKEVSAALFLREGSTCYYLFGAGSELSRPLGGSTFVLTHLMHRCLMLGSSDVDFVGANSPRRADFKQSFGGELRTYFEIKLPVK